MSVRNEERLTSQGENSSRERAKVTYVVVTAECRAVADSSPSLQCTASEVGVSACDWTKCELFTSDKNNMNGRTVTERTYTGSVSHCGHTGSVAQCGHTGSIAHSEYIRSVAHSGHTGSIAHIEHMGSVAHIEHTGSVAHCGHTGSVEHSEHTPEVLRKRTYRKYCARRTCMKSVY